MGLNITEFLKERIASKPQETVQSKSFKALDGAVQFTITPEGVFIDKDSYKTMREGIQSKRGFFSDLNDRVEANIDRYLSKAMGSGMAVGAVVAAGAVALSGPAGLIGLGSLAVATTGIAIASYFGDKANKAKEEKGEFVSKGGSGAGLILGGVAVAATIVNPMAVPAAAVILGVGAVGAFGGIIGGIASLIPIATIKGVAETALDSRERLEDGSYSVLPGELKSFAAQLSPDEIKTFKEHGVSISESYLGKESPFGQYVCKIDYNKMSRKLESVHEEVIASSDNSLSMG